MRLKRPIAASAAGWLGKGFFRFLLLMAAAAAVAALAAGFGIAHDYSYLRASILAGSQGGKYYALATRLADRAAREHGTLRVIPTAGSIENVKRLTAGRGHCTEMFALIQDGTPVSRRCTARRTAPSVSRGIGGPWTCPTKAPERPRRDRTR